MMNNSILEQATAVFDTEEKWKAFHEIEIAVPSIRKHWLTIGADAMRAEFDKRQGGWVCSSWGVEQDTKWYIAEFGESSISIGIGWLDFNFYLFDGRLDAAAWNKAGELLGRLEFEQMVSRIGAPNHSTNEGNRLLLTNFQFDPFGPDDDSAFRARRIAWHAAHDTERFVEMTLRRVRQITEDEEMVRLIVELNNLSAATDGV